MAWGIPSKRLFNFKDLRRIYRNMASPEAYESTLDKTTEEVEAMVDFFISVIESIRYHDDEIDFYSYNPVAVKSNICSALYYAQQALCPKGKVTVTPNPYGGGEFGGGGSGRDF